MLVMTLASGVTMFVAVQPSAQAGFPNHQIAFLFRKKFQRHHGDDFKKCRVMVGGKLFEQRLQFFDQPDDFGFGNQLAVDLNPFAETKPDAAK